MRNKERGLVEIIKLSGLSVAAVSTTLLFPTGLYLMGHGIPKADAPEICCGVLSAAAGVGLPMTFANLALNTYRDFKNRNRYIPE